MAKKKKINKLGVAFARACVQWELTNNRMDVDGDLPGILELGLEDESLFDVGGSYGHLIVNHLGHIMGWQDDNGEWCRRCPKEYDMIRLFDIKCYLKHSKTRTVDICELSDWDKDGNFTKFDKATRKRTKGL